MTDQTEPPPKAETMKRGEGARFVLSLIAAEAGRNVEILRAEAEADTAAETDAAEPGTA